MIITIMILQENFTQTCLIAMYLGVSLHAVFCTINGPWCVCCIAAFAEYLLCFSSLIFLYFNFVIIMLLLTIHFYVCIIVFYISSVLFVFFVPIILPLLCIYFLFSFLSYETHRSKYLI